MTINSIELLATPTEVSVFQVSNADEGIAANDLVSQDSGFRQVNIALNCYEKSRQNDQNSLGQQAFAWAMKTESLSYAFLKNIPQLANAGATSIFGYVIVDAIQRRSLASEWISGNLRSTPAYYQGSNGNMCFYSEVRDFRNRLRYKFRQEPDPLGQTILFTQFENSESIMTVQNEKPIQVAILNFSRYQQEAQARLFG